MDDYCNLLDKKGIEEVISKIKEQSSKGKKIVLVNIGTDKVITDAFGPFLGQMIEERGYKNIINYGTLEDPIHALNLERRLESILYKHENDFIIATDAMLPGDDKSKEENKKRDNLCYSFLPVSPGKGVGKSLPKVGDMKIVYCLDMNNSDSSFFASSCYRLGKVYAKCRQVVKLFDMIETELEEIQKIREIIGG